MLMGNSKAEKRILQVFAFKLPRRLEPESYRGSGYCIRQSFSPRHPQRTSNMFKTGFRCPLSENLSTVAIGLIILKVASSILTRHILPVCEMD